MLIAHLKCGRVTSLGFIESADLQQEICEFVHEERTSDSSAVCVEIWFSQR